MGAQPAVGSLPERGGLPPAVVETGAVPSVGFERGIINLPLERAVDDNGRGVCAPRAVAYHRLPAAVGVFNFQTAEKAESAKRGVAPPQCVVEAVSEHGADDIFSPLQQVGDVVGEIHHSGTAEFVADDDRIGVEVLPGRIIGEVGHEFVLSRFLAVDIQLEESESCDKHFCSRRLARQMEIFAQHGRRSGGLA